MTTFRIYHGAARPIVARGKNVARLLEFAEKYRGWHTYRTDRATRNAIRIGERDGWLEIAGDQFRFQYPRGRA